MKIEIRDDISNALNEIVRQRKSKGETITIEKWIEDAIHEKAIREKVVLGQFK